MMGMPGRSEVCERFDEVLLATRSKRPGALAHGRDADARPAICVIGIDGFPEIVELDPDGAEAAVTEVFRRLDQLVRSVDVLGRIATDRMVLAVPGLAPAVAGSLVERIAGAAAMPIGIADRTVSIGVTVGVAFAEGDDDAGAVLERAEAELDRLGQHP